MEQRTKELLLKISNLDINNITIHQIESLCEQAKSVLIDNLKAQTIENYKLSLSWNVSLKETILKADKVGFIHESYYKEETKHFLNDNFDKIDFILETLKNYLESGENNG